MTGGEREKERERETCVVGYRSSLAEIGELSLHIVQKRGCFIERSCQIRSVLIQHLTVSFLQKNHKLIEQSANEEINYKHTIDSDSNLTHHEFVELGIIAQT